MTNRASAATHPPPERETAPSGKGAAAISKAAKPSSETYTDGAASAMPYAKPEHLAAARAVIYMLGADDVETCAIGSEIFRLRLRRRERVALAWAAICSVDDEDIEELLDVTFGGAGMPVAPFLNHADEAASWAALATLDELRAYGAAILVRLSPKDRQNLVKVLRRAS